MSDAGPKPGAVLIARLHDPAKLLARPEGPGIRDAHASLFAGLVMESGGEVERIEYDTELEWTATFAWAGDALRTAVAVQQHALGLEPLTPRLQTACGIFLQDEREVRSYLFPRGSTGGRIVVTEPAYAALGDAMQAAYEWLEPRAPRWRRKDHEPRACFWDERFTLLNAPFERAFSLETTRWIGPRRSARGLGALPFPERPDVRNGLVGLGLGGGGMRAAVFSLGVTQALARNHALKDVDYLASVSGGGYLGSSLQALMAEDLPYEEPRRFGLTSGTFPFGFPRPADASGGTATSTGHAVHGVESPALRYVREHARFLGKGIGLFDGYTWRLVGQGMLSIVLLWVLLLLPPIVLAASAGMVFRGWFQDYSADAQRLLVVSPLAFALIAWVVTVFSPPWWRPLWLWLGRSVVLASVIVAAFVVFAVVSTPSDRTAFNDAARTVASLAPLLLFGVSAIAVLLFEVLRSVSRKPSQQDRWSETAQRTANYLSLLAGAVAAILVVVFLVWVIENTAYHNGRQDEARAAIAIVQVGGLAITLASIRKLSDMAAPVRGSLSELIPRLALIVGGYLALATAVGLASWGLWWLWAHGESSWLWALNIASAVSLLIFGLWGRVGFPALNWLAPHRLYAGLIQEGWIIAGKPAKAEREGGVRVRQWFRVWRRPDLRLSSLRSMDGRKLTAPYPLICTTLNLPGTRDPRMPDRTCDSFVLGPLTTGSALTRWVHTERYTPSNGMRLSTATAISGAAVAPGLGFRTTRTLSIILTLFNVRLGQWLENPRPAGRGIIRSALHSRPISLYWKEMLGLADHDDGHVYLSDGEHFEGLGVYELLRRRCKYIVAVAADVEKGSGAPVKLGKLGSALRLARVDFGVEVEFASLQPLMREAKDSDFVASYFAAGVIRYPHAGGHTHGDEGGIMIVIKTGLVDGTLPADIVNYLRGADPGFPNNPTQDLQYDQPQFESLRQLGFIAGEAMCRAGKTDTTDLAAETTAGRFERILGAYRKLCEPVAATGAPE